MPAGVYPPYLSVGQAPRAFSFCIFKTWSLRLPGPEGNKNPKVVSSKQATLGMMVSQFRKLRFPLMIRTTYGMEQRLRSKLNTDQGQLSVQTLPSTWGALVGGSPTIPSSCPRFTCSTRTQQLCSDAWIPHLEALGPRVSSFFPEAHVGTCANSQGTRVAGGHGPGPVSPHRPHT